MIMTINDRYIIVTIVNYRKDNLNSQSVMSYARWSMGIDTGSIWEELDLSKEMASTEIPIGYSVDHRILKSGTLTDHKAYSSAARVARKPLETSFGTFLTPLNCRV